jgi:hypothetical protein
MSALDFYVVYWTLDGQRHSAEHLGLLQAQRDLAHVSRYENVEDPEMTGPFTFSELLDIRKAIGL